MVSVPTCRLPVTVIAESFVSAAAASAHAAIRRNIDRITEKMAAKPRPSIAIPHGQQAERHHSRLRRRDRDRLCRNLRYCWGVCRNGLRLTVRPGDSRGRMKLERPRGVVEQFLDRI